MVKHKSEKQKFLETWEITAKEEYRRNENFYEKSFSEFLQTNPIGKHMLEQKARGLKTVARGNTR